MSDSRLPTFVGLSSVLTGIPAGVLAPKIDPLKLKTVYFDKMVAEVGDQQVNALLEAYTQVAEQEGLDDPSTPDPTSQQAQRVGTKLMNPGDVGDAFEYQANLCASIIKMWYLGSWYPVSYSPPEPTDAHYFSGSVVTAEAYKRSRVWKIAQTHPMGFSQWEFGYWTEVPASLDEFIEGK